MYKTIFAFSSSRSRKIETVKNSINASENKRGNKPYRYSRTLLKSLSSKSTQLAVLGFFSVVL